MFTPKGELEHDAQCVLREVTDLRTFTLCNTDEKLSAVASDKPLAKVPGHLSFIGAVSFRLLSRAWDMSSCGRSLLQWAARPFS